MGILDGAVSGDDLMDVLWRAVDAAAAGEPVDEDDVHDAVCALVAAELVAAGVAAGDVARQFDGHRDYNVRLNYAPKTGKLDFTVDWLDGEVVEAGAQ